MGGKYIYIADSGNSRIRKVNVTGIISTVGSNIPYVGSGGWFTEGVPAAVTYLNANKLTTDKNNNLYLSLNDISSVFQIDTFGFVHRIAGNNIAGYMGDGLNATAAELWFPSGVAIDPTGHLFISDASNNMPVIREVCCLTMQPDLPPLFTHGAPYTLTLCASSAPVSIDSLLRVLDGDASDTLKWNIGGYPAHGTLGGLPYSQVSGGSTVTPSGLYYTPTAGFWGTDNFTIRITDGIDVSSININVVVNPLPTAGISGAASVCASDSIILPGSPAGGAWSATNGNATVNAAGKVYGITGGTDTINYIITNSCGIATASKIITINPQPTVGSITGAAVVCEGSSITLSNTVGGGTWSSSSPYLSITTGSGIVIGYAPGTATISYTRSNMCGTATTTANVTVSSATWPGTLSGAPSLCTGGTTTISSTVAGGTWSSGSTSVATVGSSSGVVIGVAPGASIISYTVNGACGSATAITIVNVSSATPIAPITGGSSVCTGNTATLSDASAGGTWSSSNPAIASVSSTGIVTGNAAGIVMISYTASLGCGVSVATFNMVVNVTPTAGTLSGPATLCEGANALMSSTVAGGSWSAGGSHAMVGIAGILTGVSAGTEIVTYTITNACGSATGTYTINVFAAPNAGTLSGATTLCAGTTTVLSSTASGGTWSSSNTAVGTISSAGVVSGLAGGTTTISYIVTTGCGAAVTTRAVTVNAPSAGIISGITYVCSGGVSTLSSSVASGAWSSSAPAVATISGGGIVNALAGGATLISYAVTTPCGTDVATAVFTVGSLPVVSPVAGAANLCAGSSTTLSDATLGGVWSSSETTVATINSSGVVTGVTAGTTTISYMVTGGCGTSGATFVLTVNAIPSVPSISGAARVCESGMTTLSSSLGGGAWSSSNSAVASVVAGTGAVTGAVAGTATLTYAISNVCGSSAAARVVTVNPLPYAGAVFGAAHVCAGATLTLSATVGGGTWSSSNATVASVGSSTGVVSGATAGSATISYSKSNSCGMAVATAALTVDPLPVVGTTTGADTICAGTATLYTNATGGGIWGTSAPGVASVSALGTVTGVGAGAVRYIMH